MKVLSIAALASLLTLSALSMGPANADDYRWRHNNGWHNGYNNGYNGGYNNNWNNGWNYRNNSRVYPSTINNRQMGIENRIQYGAATGRLSPLEASKLQANYNRINMLEAQLRGSNNHLSYNERARLNADLARLNQQVGRNMYDRNNW